MPLTLEEQRELEQLGREFSVLKQQQEAPKPSGDAYDYWASYSPAFDELLPPPGARTMPRGMQSAMLEGGGAAVGAKIGAIPAFSVPTGGLSIPAGAAIGGVAGMVGDKLIHKEKPTKGEIAGSAVANAIPGANLAKSGASAIIREAGKQTAANIAAKATETAVDEGRPPTATEAGAATLGAVVGTAGNKAVGRYAKAEAEAVRASQRSHRDHILKLAQASGYILDPVHANPNATTRAVSELGNSSQFVREAVVHNQEITNRLIRAEIGLPPDAPLDTMQIAKRIVDVKAPYQEIASLSPLAKNALEKLQSVRADARDAWKDYGATARVESKRAAIKADQQAEALESGLESLAKKANRPELVGQMREARKQLAKIHYVEAALNASAGEVDAKILGRIHDANPRLLTDNLKTVAELANIQPYMVRGATEMRAAVNDVGQFRPIAAAYDATVGQFLRGAQRSGTYQQAMGLPKYQMNAPDAAATFILKGSQAAGR
jgi:hypothetical protein